MEIVIPEIAELREEIKALREIFSDAVILDQEWYDLESACRLKGLKKNTLYSKPKYQPNYGKADAIVCGKKRWRKTTIREWLKQTDDDIPEIFK